MKKRLGSLALALVLCLGMTVPALAAEEEKPLSRAGLAVLLARYGEPEKHDKGYGEEIRDCDRLSEEEQAAIAAVVNARWMTSPMWGAFGPDIAVTRWSAATSIAHAADPELAHSSAPKRPNLAVQGADGPWAPEPGAALVTEEEYEAAIAAWERQYEDWVKNMRSRFKTLPDNMAHTLCEPLEILSSMGVLDPNAITADLWMQSIPAATAEEWVKAAFGYSGSKEPAEPEKPAETPPAAPAFADVPAGAYYAEPVQWAVEKKITTGTSDTAFSPGKTCNRGQILTFLWRASGSPESGAANPFTDLKDSDYCYQAALWAAEKGLVSGSAFGAGTDCTRAMTMEYLWKAAGSPAPAGQAGFTDVPADADYAQAVAWAVENQITSGTTDTTFSPDATCTRGQIVTFLHRAMG